MYSYHDQVLSKTMWIILSYELFQFQCSQACSPAARMYVVPLYHAGDSIWMILRRRRRLAEQFSSTSGECCKVMVHSSGTTTRPRSLQEARPLSVNFAVLLTYGRVIQRGATITSLLWHFAIDTLLYLRWSCWSLFYFWY